MRIIFFVAVLLLVGCHNNETKNTSANADTLTSQAPDKGLEKITDVAMPSNKTYFNKRFRDVTVERVGENKFRIKGEGQIFEANFNWIVEDGHEELKKGYQVTDAGAPDWGEFDFTIDVQKKRENSTLTLVLFESSAMDGSRQYELPIFLY